MYVRASCNLRRSRCDSSPPPTVMKFRDNSDWNLRIVNFDEHVLLILLICAYLEVVIDDAVE